MAYSAAGGAPHLPFEVEGKPSTCPCARAWMPTMPARSSPRRSRASARVRAGAAGAAACRRGSLVPVLAEFMPTDLWLYAAYTQRRHNSAALRALLDLLDARMGESPVAAVQGHSYELAAQL
jgi:DNA-binding transcriptional LysR family regulator